MNICFSSDLIGVKKNLLCNESEFAWVKQIPENTWIIGGGDSPWDLPSIIRAAGQEVPQFPPEKFRKPWGILRPDNCINVPWLYVLPPDMFKRYVSDSLDSFWCFLNDNSNRYYLEDFKDHRGLLDKLSRVRVNKAQLEKNILNTEQQTLCASLKKFTPDSAGFAKKIRYSQTGTVTGRLTVAEGPNILTLKKDYRNIFESQFENGVIVQIDIQSLEPRIAMYIADQKCDGDIYENIFSQFQIEIPRAQAKQIVISVLYGMSARNLRKTLPAGFPIESVLKDITTFFQISRLGQIIQKQIKERGYFTNYYGRKLKGNGAHINHYLQSTGVDVSLNAFSYLINHLERNSCRFHPHFVIHDALIIDIDNKDMNILRNAVDNGLVVSRFKHRFPAKISKF
jgi:hypothetical protein